MSQAVFFTGGSGLLALNWAMEIQSHYSVTLGLHERKINLRGMKTLEANLASPAEVLRALDTVQPDIVVHAAGVTNVETCESNPRLAEEVNVRCAANVARGCATRGVRLVHVSTDHLFAGVAAGADESWTVEPQNVYARTKAQAELEVLQTLPSALVVRTNFFGWGPSYRRSFSDSIIAALRADRELLLFQDVFFTPILIAALAGAVHDLLDRKAVGIFHVAGDDRISKHDFGLAVARYFQLDARLIKAGSIRDQPGLVRRPLDMSLSNRKLRALLGRGAGGIADHLTRLREQEDLGLAGEIQQL